MVRVIALAGTVLAAWPCIAQAQDAPLPVASASDAAQAGILVYPPEFFAGASLNTAFEMIQRVPGFSLEAGNADSRGLAGAAGNVLIDGRPPSSKTDNLPDILRRIPAASVERIELVRGGAPGIDMQGRAVIANVVLRRTASTQIALETNLSLYRDGYVGPLLKGQYSRTEGDSQTELAFSATTDHYGYTAEGTRVRYDAAGKLFQTADLDLWDRYRNGNLRGVIQRRAGGGKLRVNALIDYANNNNRQDITILSGPGVNEHNQDVDHSWSGELGANWSRALGPRTQLDLIALQRGARQRYDSSSGNSGGAASEFDIDATSGESVLRGTLKFRPNDRWAFEGGGEVAYNFRDTASSYSQNGTPVALPNAQVLVSELRGEAFGQGTFRPGPSLTVEAALRAEFSRISQTGDTDKSKQFFYPKPRLQLIWAPAPGHQVRLRAERSVSQLNFGDFSASTEINLGTVLGGNADLVPQKSTTYEAVYEYRFWEKGALELSLAHSQLDDVIDVVPVTGGFDGIGNIGSGTLDVVGGRLTVPLDKLGLGNALLVSRFTYQHSRVTDPLTGERRRLSSEIGFDCSISFNQDLAGGRFAYGFEHGCNRNIYSIYRTREVRRFDHQPRVSVYGQWKPNSKMTVRVDIGNVTRYRLINGRELHSGPRNSTPILFSEKRFIWPGQFLFLQVRHVL